MFRRIGGTPMTPSYNSLHASNFIEGISALTGIATHKLQKYARDHNLFNILDHPYVIESTPRQLEKLHLLNEFLVSYKLLRFEESQGKSPFRSPDDAGKFFAAQLGHVKDKEKLMVAFLDNGNHLIESRVMSEGSVGFAQVYPREILKAALNCDCAAIILAHNHPGGSLRPSMEDQILTERLVSIFSPLHISVLDHLIIANGTYASMAAMGQLPQPSDDKVNYESIKLRSETSTVNEALYENHSAAWDDFSSHDTTWEEDEFER